MVGTFGRWTTSVECGCIHKYAQMHTRNAKDAVNPQTCNNRDTICARIAINNDGRASRVDSQTHITRRGDTDICTHTHTRRHVCEHTAAPPKANKKDTRGHTVSHIPCLTHIRTYAHTTHEVNHTHNIQPDRIIYNQYTDRKAVEIMDSGPRAMLSVM